MAGAKKDAKTDPKTADKGQVPADTKPAGADAPEKEPVKVDKRRKTDGKTCRQSLFDLVRTEAMAPKNIIKGVVEETGCAPATVRTHINKMWNEGNLGRKDADGTGYLYFVSEDSPMLAKQSAKAQLDKAEAAKAAAEK